MLLRPCHPIPFVLLMALCASADADDAELAEVGSLPAFIQLSDSGEKIVSGEIQPLDDERLSSELTPVEIIELPNGQEEIIVCEPCETGVVIEESVSEEHEPKVRFGDWVGYNTTQSKTTWLSGSDFGMFSAESLPSLDIDNRFAILAGTGFHFLNGPKKPDLPPRLFDFQLAVQARKQLGSESMLDVRLGVGAFSDFEGSARDGVRFPGHIVAYFDHGPDVATVWGVEALDRDDISVLPVAGFVWRPYDDLIFECVFPRPSVQMRLDHEHALYFGAELSGGTWAVERFDDQNRAYNDNVTYNDIRMTCGIMDFGNDSDSVLEVGWAFDRSLTFRSTVGDTDLGGAFILRCHTHF